MDNRIGFISEEQVKWPAQTISGVTAYAKPATMVFFGGGYFAVVEPFLDNQKLSKLQVELQEIVDRDLKPKTVSKFKAEA